LTLLACLVLVANASARSVQVAGARMDTRTIAGSDYLSLQTLATAVSGKCWQVAERFVVVVPGDSVRPSREYVFRPDSTVAFCDGRRALLPAAPVLDSGRLYLPVLAVTELFPSSSLPVLAALSVSGLGDTLLFRASVTGTAQDVVFFGDTKSSLEYRLVVGARRDSAFCAQVAMLSLTPPALLKSVALDSGTTTTVRFVFRQPAMERVAIKPEGVELRVWPRPQRQMKRLMLDPGHGGEDPGALGRQGTREKIVVMDVVKRLKTKLEKQGFEVILTRDTDRFVSLAERSRGSNGHKADLFISVHANASPNRAACGLETYFLSEAKTDWERAVAARENASLGTSESAPGPGTAGDLGLILADLAQNEFLFESSELAAQIQTATVKQARIKDRSVRQANFYVLRNSFMPAVLVECGFLSNKSEEKLLRKPEHRERLAEGICQGIVAFSQQFGPRANGGRTGNGGSGN
jgi:N-acetylmuramoyl-L-alanine amidase